MEHWENFIPKSILRGFEKNCTCQMAFRRFSNEMKFGRNIIFFSPCPAGEYGNMGEYNKKRGTAIEIPKMVCYYGNNPLKDRTWKEDAL